MRKYYEFKNGSPIEYDLGELQCPICGWTLVAYFQVGRLVKSESCPMCFLCVKEIR